MNHEVGSRCDTVFQTEEENSHEHINPWFHMFKHKTDSNAEDEAQMDENSNWWKNAEVEKVSLSEDDYVKDQYLDVKEINHSDFDNLDTHLPIKTNKSDKDLKHSVNDAYNKYKYESNVMIEQIALSSYNNQVEKQKEQESLFHQWCKKGDTMVGLTLLEV